jgi:hypothetical protein
MVALLGPIGEFDSHKRALKMKTTKAEQLVLEMIKGRIAKRTGDTDDCSGRSGQPGDFGSKRPREQG